MEIAELRRQTSKLNAELEERRNAAAVFETTIRKRLPELEQLVASANSALDERAADLDDLQRKLERREEMLQQVQRSAALQQEELARLRTVLERQGADKTGRFKRRPMEWGLDEYRSEYDRLNLEMSRMREQLARASELETHRIPVLKREMQQLAEQIIASASARESAGRDWRERETEIRQQERPQPRQPQAPRGQRQTPLVTSTPWPGEPQKAPAPATHVNTPRAPIMDQAAPAAPIEKPQAFETMPDGQTARPVRPNLSALLADAVKNDAAMPATPEPAPSEEKAVAKADGAQMPASDADAMLAKQESGSARLDEVFREILDGSSSAATAEPATAKEDRPEQPLAEDARSKSAENSTKTLVDRLRLVQERQTG
jgi:hypothetical protein